MPLVVGITSSRSSPGVTSLAVGLAAAFARRSVNPVVIEADPAGGVIGQRFGLAPQPTVLDLVRRSAGGITEDGLRANVVVHNEIGFVQAPVDPSAAESALLQLGRLAVDGGFMATSPLLVDLGRWSQSEVWSRLVQSVDHVLLMTASRLEDVQAARFAAAACRTLARPAGLVVRGSKPFSPQEVAAAVDAALVGVLPDDPKHAPALTGQIPLDAAFQRSSVAKAIDSLAAALLSVRHG